MIWPSESCRSFVRAPWSTLVARVQRRRVRGDARFLVDLQRRAARLDRVQIDRLVVDEVGERAHRVRAAARAGDHVGREVAGLLDRLLARLGDDRLEVADHHRERVRADDEPMT